MPLNDLCLFILGLQMKVFAKRAFLESGWAKDVRLNVENGVIAGIETGVVAESDDTSIETLLPALSNLHSHSFQRAMAGMTELRTKGRESFWTWRDLMYRFLDQLTPDHIEAIAQLAFMEMQKSGYAAVGEFHYVHHAAGGQHYDDQAELSARIMQAAEHTGIGLTHLPVLYTYGDVGGKPLAGGQKRFENSVEAYVTLVELCKAKASAGTHADMQVGIAPHSLRATSPADLASVVAQYPYGPVHIHIAEQVKEVESVEAVLGARPVEWLLNNTDVDRRWCLIHATHMTQDETRGVATHGAVAGLCPVTEANLGDGIFNGSEFLASNGAFGVGTDSNVNISLTEELRVLEYSQRLKLRQRNVLVDEQGSTGETLYTGAARGGAQALNRNSGVLATGKLADLVAIDTTVPSLCTLAEHQILDGFVFAANDSAVTDVWSAGRHQVRGGRHIAEEQITSRYRQEMSGLMAAIG